MRILALDVGTKKIGLALTDETGTIASPYKTIERKTAIAKIVEIVSLETIDRVVVGIPYLESGKLGSQAEDVWKFIEELKVRLEIELDYENENLTSFEAEERLKEKKKRTKGDVDSMAAAIILESYLARSKNE